MTPPDIRLRRAKLFLISFVILFLELAAIRWLNASVPVLAYFNNFILLSSFFGLGLGCLLASRKVTLVHWYAPALLALVGVIILLNRFGIDISYDLQHAGDFVFAPNDEYYQTGLLQVSLSALVGFFINVAFFVLLGQELGRRIAAFENPLVAYGWDIAGSLAGVLAFAAMSWFQTPPHVWFGIGAVLLLLFVLDRRVWALASLAMVVVALVSMQQTYAGAQWSPYYKVEVERLDDARDRYVGFSILVDNVRIQDALDLRPEFHDSNKVGGWIPYYELPYHLCRPKNVLVLGAGSGNEVMTAKRFGAETVDAVEIDPIIARYGREDHPNRPYTLPGVTSVVNDARSFVSLADERYDLIVMSALDSHRQIRGMSSLRLESFVYTVEAFREMKRLLAPGGVFCLNVSSYRPWIGDRVYWSLTEAFGEQPLQLVSGGMAAVSVAYVFAPPEKLEQDQLPSGYAISSLPPPARPDDLVLSTDDWPHLYLEAPAIPNTYLVVLGLLMLGSVLLVTRADPAVRRPNLHFFFLGAGFMLLETRSVTQMALAFGSTWSVNAIVFAAILATILAANALVLKGRTPRRRTCYVLLTLTLAAGYVFPFESLLTLPLATRLLAGAVVVGLPIFWASLVFSISFREETDVTSVFGSNLLGVVTGGCLEYLSNLWGLNVLYLLALALYAGSAICQRRGRLVAAS